MKKFVIVPGLKYYFFKDIKDPNIYVEEEKFLSSTNFCKNYIQRFSKKINLWPIYLLFIIEWKKKLKECDSCIIFDQAFSVALVKAIKFLNPNIKIYIYLWNPTFKDTSITKKLNKVKNLISIYSFDKNDCKKYGFKFSPMIYNLDIKYKKEEIIYDVIFVGYLKNRVQLLTELYNKLQEFSASTYFYVLDNIKTKDKVPFELHDTYLEYDEYRKKMICSKAVLDIVQDGQIGLTIRTMETICYGKKLITNNLDIINYDFYNKNNIFVIGIDDINTLEQFIKLPFVPIPSEVLKKYNFVDWIKSF